jgi:haloacetate dehalogenase
LDEADAATHLACPVLVLWSAEGIGSGYDVEAIWRARASDLRGRALECGHFLAEERPREVARELGSFFAV